MSKVNLSHVSNMHNQWLRNLNFYKSELAILKGILTEIAGKYTGGEVSKEVEHFENQFKIQTDNIDTISHDIHVNIGRIGKEAQQSSAGYIDGDLLTEHTALGQRAEAEEKIAIELIHSFRKFAERWM
jgi:hypothetical protein